MVRTVTGASGVTIVNGLTPEELATALEEYATDAEVASALEPYVTAADVTTALEPYVTDADVATELEAYVTDADLTTALTPYATTDLVATALGPYATDADVTAAMATKQPLSATLTSVAQIEPKVPWFLAVRDTPDGVGRVYPPPGVSSGVSPFAVTGKTYGNYTYTAASSSNLDGNFNFPRCFTQLAVNRDPGGTTWKTQTGRYDVNTGVYLGATSNTLTDGSVYTGEFGDIAFGQYMLFQRIRFTHFSAATRPKRIVLVAGSRPAPALAFELIADITCTYDGSGYCDVAIPTQGRLYNNMRMIVPEIQGAGSGGTESFCGLCSLTWLAAEPNQINGSAVFSGTQHHFESVPTVGSDSQRLVIESRLTPPALSLYHYAQGTTINPTNPALTATYRFLKPFTVTGGRQLWQAQLTMAGKVAEDAMDVVFKANGVEMYTSLMVFTVPDNFQRMTFTWTTTLAYNPLGYNFTMEWDDMAFVDSRVHWVGVPISTFDCYFVEFGG